MKKKNFLFFRILNKIFNNLNLKYFFLSKLVAKYFFFKNYPVGLWRAFSASGMDAEEEQLSDRPLVI